MSMTEQVKPILREIDQLRNKEAKQEKALNETRDAIEAKLKAVRNIVNGATPEVQDESEDDALSV